MGVLGVPRAGRCGGDSAVLRSLSLSASGCPLLFMVCQRAGPWRRVPS